MWDADVGQVEGNAKGKLRETHRVQVWPAFGGKYAQGACRRGAYNAVGGVQTNDA